MFFGWTSLQVPRWPGQEETPKAIPGSAGDPGCGDVKRTQKSLVERR